MKVLCISGKAGSGKDTLANLICENLESKGQCVLITHFADLLKYICEKFFAWDGVKNEESRTLLQYVGTDVIRTKRPDYWGNFVIDVLKLFPNEWDYVLIPDCRFPNEFENFKKNGIDAKLIRITRPDSDSGLTSDQKNHPSEIAMDKYSYIDGFVVNKGTLDDLAHTADKMIKFLYDI